LEDKDLSRVLERTLPDAVMTTSLGRLLDALSSLMLGVTWRTYDGEPAMRLEALLASSRSPVREPFMIAVKGGVVPVVARWKALLDEISASGAPEMRPGVRIDMRRRADLSMGFVGSIVDDLVGVVADRCGEWTDSSGRRFIGLSGGVAYDLPIVKAFAEACWRRGALPVLHSRVPPGDAGISLGQAAVAGRKL